MMLDSNYYRLADKSLWSGRFDGSERMYQRWHQLMQFSDLNDDDDFEKAVVFLGFACDEGVRRNQGRVGAKESPMALRKILAGLPVHFSEEKQLLDAGDVFCDDQNLESAQVILAEAVTKIIQRKGFPVILGGGHGVTYGHFLGIQKADVGRIGIINIDAHLDIRETVDGVGTSGTGFYQIAQNLENRYQSFEYLAIGIQQISNTRALFDFAQDKGVEIIEARKIVEVELDKILRQIETFSKKVDQVYLTIDLDVFAAPYAPGVSALAFHGVVPDAVFNIIFDTLIKLPNLISVDIAELNPTYDIDNRTARLAADLVFKIVSR